jgi:hypothetical protein
LAPIGEPIAPLTAPDHFVTPLGRSELVGLIGQPPLRHTHCAVAVWAHPAARLGPLAGHYARRMPVIQGQLRAVPDESSPACRRSGRDLPSWSCEFDSRHPLHPKGPVRGLFCAAVAHPRRGNTARAITWAIDSGGHRRSPELQLSKLRHSRFHCLLDRCSAPVSKSRRLIQIESLAVPRRPSRLRVTRCRTSVTIVFASATRCHLSMAIFTPGRAARIPDAYGADGSITTIWIRCRNTSDCSPSQSLTEPPVPGCEPEQCAWVAGCAVHEAGHPRVGASPGDPVENPADRPEAGLVDCQHGRPLGLGHGPG